MTRDPDIREATADLGSGMKLHYAEAGVGQGRPLILLHGYTDSWRSFRLVIPLLAHTAHVFAPDHRGHGDSSAPPGDYTMTRLARDVVEFMDRLGLSTATLVGHSMGSFVARRAALDAPKRVERLVLVGSGASVDNAVVRGLREEVNRFGEWVPEEFVEQFQASCVHRPDLLPGGFFDACVAASRRVPLHVWRAAMDGMLAEDHAAPLASISQPTLIIGGRHDTVFSVPEQEELARAIPRACLRLYRHSGHAPNWEEPGRFAEDVEDFLVHSNADQN